MHPSDPEPGDLLKPTASDGGPQSGRFIFDMQGKVWPELACHRALTSAARPSALERW